MEVNSLRRGLYCETANSPRLQPHRLTRHASDINPRMRAKAIKAINKTGCLLVYPLANKPEPKSIWSELYPRSKMRWEWDTGGDDRVAKLWYLRTDLSSSREVVYAKWFQGRATFFSRHLFTHMLSHLNSTRDPALSHQSREVLDILKQDSPLSTKQLKAAATLEGRVHETLYNRAMNPLWRRLLLVGFGEFEDSSFPSLGIGATETLFEDLWNDALKISQAKASEVVLQQLGAQNPFWKFAEKLRKTLP